MFYFVFLFSLLEVLSVGRQLVLGVRFHTRGGTGRQADRRAMGAGSELKSFDIDNKYGRDALRQLYGEIAEALPPMNGLTQPKPPRCHPRNHPVDDPATGHATTIVGPWVMADILVYQEHLPFNVYRVFLEERASS